MAERGREEIGYGNTFSSKDHDWFNKNNVLLAFLTFPQFLQSHNLHSYSRRMMIRLKTAVFLF